jgi:signal transduction histidine kinase
VSRRVRRIVLAQGLRRTLALLILAWCAGAAWASSTIEFKSMERAILPPMASPLDQGPTTAWTPVPLPDTVTPSGIPADSTLWYRARFEWSPDSRGPLPWAVWLPFLYDGGQVWINGSLAGAVQEGTPALRVRWERPHLIAVPAGQLRPGWNQVLIRTGAASAQSIRHFPQMALGPEPELRRRTDRRTFWVRTLPQVTAVVCLLVSGFVLFIYWRRRTEVLYGLFGLVSALWGIRTLTFVLERMPAESWHLWRIVYHGATGGFIVVLLLFALRFAGIRRPTIEKALVAYWLLGPLWLWWAGPSQEGGVSRIWTGGLIPIGLTILCLSIWTMWRQRTFAAAIMPCMLVIAVMTGLHDYLLVWQADALKHILPAWWVEQRIFLLHVGANGVLLGMAGLLTARFLHALSSLELANGRLADLNDTLESRVTQRERHLAENFERLAVLQSEQAAAHERQLIMREIHDGLGSRLFTSLLRVERGDMSHLQIAEVLRDCIADMRLALEVLAPDDDFRAALGSFLFRWQTQMQEAHVAPSWSIDVPDEALDLSRQQALQLLRIAQETLTNVLKHAGAKNVRIDLRLRQHHLELEVADDGRGVEDGGAPNRPTAGRGIANMHARARQLSGDLKVRSGLDGTRVLLRLPLARPSSRHAQVAPTPQDPPIP